MQICVQKTLFFKNMKKSWHSLVANGKIVIYNRGTTKAKGHPCKRRLLFFVGRWRSGRQTKIGKGSYEKGCWVCS